MAPESRDLLETIHTTRSVRRYKPDPIPDDVLQVLLDAAIRAPNGSNNQTWRILVIRNPELRRQVGEQYSLAYQQYNPVRLANEPDPNRQRLVRSSQHLGATMGTEPPVLVLLCLVATASSSSQRSRGASAYPFVQNLLLAAHAYGIGGCLTTIHLRREQQVKTILGIPDDVDTFALIPLGYPSSDNAFGPVRRQPVEDVAFLDTWGNGWGKPG